MRLYMKRNPLETRNAVHGVDYHRGLEDGRECGTVHEFMTKNCQPVIFTEDEKNDWHNQEGFVEVVRFGLEDANDFVECAEVFSPSGFEEV
jgi:hypothetical protein